MRRLRSLWAAALLLRRLRLEVGVAILLFILVASTSFVFAAAPRLFNGVSDDAVRYAARVATPVQRSVSASLVSNIGATPGEGVESVAAYGAQVRTQLPPSVLSLVSDEALRITTVRFLVANPPSFDTRVWLRYQDGVAAATRLVEGRWPEATGARLETDSLTGPPSAQGGRDTSEDGPAILEAAIAAGAALETGIKVGDRLAISLDGSDSLNLRVPYRLAPTEIEVVGLFEALDPVAPYWAGDDDLIQAAQLGSEDNPVAGVTAFVPAAMYPNLAASRMPFRYEWRFNTDPERLDASQVPRLQADLRRLGVLSSGGAGGAQGTVELRTGLPPILEQFTEEQALTETVLSIATIGPLGLAAGAIAMIALLLVQRRRAALALARGRGASGSLVLGTQLWESVLLAGGASLLGLVLALALVPGRASPLSATLAVAVASIATVLLVGASWPTARRPLGNLERDDAPVFRVTTRRLVIEATIVFLAVGATLLLRQRGLGGGPSTGEGAGSGGAVGGAAGGAAPFDPLLAAVPVLAGLAAGIVVLRLYPLPIRALGWLAARRRDFVPVLGLRTIGRHPGAANLPLLVLMLTAAFGAFSSVLASSIDRGQVTASYLDVGADYRVERIRLAAMAPIDAVTGTPGVESVATGMVDTSASFGSTPGQRASIYLLAIDPEAYSKVVAGSPVEPVWPQAMLAAPAADAGTEASPIPVLLSERLPAGSVHLVPGDTFRATVLGESLVFQVAEQRASFPGIPQRAAFTVVPFDWLRAAYERPPIATIYWLRAATDLGDSLATAIDAAGGPARIISRHDAYAALHDAPLEAVVATAYALALLVAAIYMALAIVGAMVLSAAGRTRDLAYLRTLGVTARQALGLTVMEHGPPVVLALIPGVLLGIAIAVLVEPGLRLSTFVGSGGVPLSIDWGALALLALGLASVVAVAVGTGTWLARRARPTDALRMGEH
jgi:putative ABC transport system permease protein